MRETKQNTNHLDTFIHKNGEVQAIGKVASIIGRNVLENIERECWKMGQMKRATHR